MLIILFTVCFLGFSPHKTCDRQSVGKTNEQKHKHRHHREHRESKQQDSGIVKDKQHGKDKQRMKARHGHKHQTQRDGSVPSGVVEQDTASVKEENSQCPKEETPKVQINSRNSEDLPSQKVNTDKQLVEDYHGSLPSAASTEKNVLPIETVSVAERCESNLNAPDAEPGGKVEVNGAISEVSEAPFVSADDKDSGMKQICQKVEAFDQKLGTQENKENENGVADCLGGVHSKDSKETVGKILIKNGSSEREDVVRLSGSGDNCNNNKCPSDARKSSSTIASVEHMPTKSPKAATDSLKKGHDNSSKQKSHKQRHKSDSSNCPGVKQKSHSIGHSRSDGQNIKAEPWAQEFQKDNKHVEEHECITNVSRCLSLGGLPEREAPKQVEASEPRLQHGSAVCDTGVKLESESTSHPQSGSVTVQGPGEHSYHRDPQTEPRHKHHSSKHKTLRHEHHHKHRHRHSSKSSSSSKSHTNSSSNDKDRKKVEKPTTSCNSKCAVANNKTNTTTQPKDSSLGRKSLSKSSSSQNHTCGTSASCADKSRSTSAAQKSKTTSKDSKRVHDVNVDNGSGSGVPLKNDVTNGLSQDLNNEKCKKAIPKCMSASPDVKLVQIPTGTPGKHALPNSNTDSTRKKRKLNFDEALLSSDNQVLAKIGKAVTPKKTKDPPSMSNATPSKTKEKPMGRHSATPKKRVASDLEVNADKYLHPTRIHDVSVQTHLDYTLQHQKYSTESPFAGFKYGHLLHRERDPNGGAWVLHSYIDELAHLSENEMQEFVDEYFKVAFSEDADGASEYTIAIVHGAAAKLPDPLEYLALKHPNLIVKIGAFGRLEIDTMTVGQFRENVHSSYCAGTHHAGGMMHISLVGVKQEETGDYLAEFLDLMERCPFLRCVMPWGTLSTLDDMPRDHSNDGPILWNRPGEQLVLPVDSSKSPFKRKR